MPRILLVVVFTAFMTAQYDALYHRDQLSVIFALYGIAFILLFLLFRLFPLAAPLSSALEEAVTPTNDVPTNRPKRLWLSALFLLISFVLAILAWFGLAGNRFTLIGVMTWIGSTLAFVGAFWQRRFSWPQGNFAQIRASLAKWWQGVNKWQLIAVILLLLLALSTRLYRLEGVPPEMNSDHVEKLLDVNDLLEGNNYIFFERNTGREPMQFYLIAAVIKLFDTGLSFYSLKLSNVVMAFISVVGTYFLGREVGGHRLGLAAGFFVAVALWAVAPSRVGLRYPFTPAFTSFSLWLLLRALRTNERNDWLLAGLFLGAGLHGYTAFRIMPLAATATVLLKILFERPAWQQLWHYTQNFILYVGASCFIFLPLARYMYESPEMFWYRSLTRSTSLESQISEPLWNLGVQTLLRTLGMFNWVGDPVFVSTISEVPVLNPITSAFFLFGLTYTLLVFTRQRPFLAFALLLNGFLLLTPSMLNFAFPNESPSVVRTGGAIPVIALFFALGVRYVYHALNHESEYQWVKVGSVGLVSLLLMAIGVINYQRYFGTYLTSYQYRSMNTAEVSATMRDYLTIVGDTDHMFTRGWPHWLDTRAIGLQLNDVEWDSRNFSMDIQPLIDMAPQDDKPFLYLINPLDQDAQQALEAHFPTGHAIIYRSAVPGHDYTIFFVPAKKTLMYPSGYELP